jgi:hypothetical protein
MDKSVSTGALISLSVVFAENIGMEDFEDEDNMATMALSLNSLIVEAEKVQADTNSLVSVSKAAVANFGLAWKVFKKTLSLRHQFALIVEKQGRELAKLAERDFSEVDPAMLESWASQIDDLIAHEREILSDTASLDVQIRAWWESSLTKLADQVEHLDSISESLHVAADPETTALMAMAIDQLVTEKHFAMR